MTENFQLQLIEWYRRNNPIYFFFCIIFLFCILWILEVNHGIFHLKKLRFASGWWGFLNKIFSLVIKAGKLRPTFKKTLLLSTNNETLPLTLAILKYNEKSLGILIRVSTSTKDHFDYQDQRFKYGKFIRLGVVSFSLQKFLGSGFFTCFL